MAAAYLYVIGTIDGCPVKIGASINVRRRMGRLQVGNPALLVIVCYFQCPHVGAAMNLEDAVHSRLARQWVRGEWYAVGWGEVRETIRAEAAARALAVIETPSPVPRQKAKPRLKSGIIAA
jgi:hypothetical protein